MIVFIELNHKSIFLYCTKKILLALVSFTFVIRYTNLLSPKYSVVSELCAALRFSSHLKYQQY